MRSRIRAAKRLVSRDLTEASRFSLCIDDVEHERFMVSMSNIDARSLDHKTFEALRIRVVRNVQAGV